MYYLKKRKKGKNMNNLFKKLFIKMVESNMKLEVNNACVFWGYQPKMPEMLKKYRKNNELSR